MAKIHVSNGIVPTGVASTAQYMKEVKKAKPMDRGVEAHLIQQAQNGDLKSRDKLIESNLRFVVQVAKQYQGMGVAFEDDVFVLQERAIDDGSQPILRAKRQYDAQFAVTETLGTGVLVRQVHARGAQKCGHAKQVNRMRGRQHRNHVAVVDGQQHSFRHFLTCDMHGLCQCLSGVGRCVTEIFKRDVAVVQILGDVHGCPLLMGVFMIADLQSGGRDMDTFGRIIGGNDAHFGSDDNQLRAVVHRQLLGVQDEIVLC